MAGPASALSDLKAYSTPVSGYTSNTCAIDLSAIADGTTMDSVSGCGVTVFFSVPVVKQTVPGGWSTWGSPPDTESATPYVLTALDQTKLTLRYSVRGRRFGVEVESNNFDVFNFTATFRRGDSTKIGSITRAVDGSAGALLFAGLVRSARTKDRIKTLTIKADPDAGGFAIAQLRVS